MKKRLTQSIGSIVLGGSFFFGAITIQAQNWAYTEGRTQVRKMSEEEARGYRAGLITGARAAQSKLRAEPKVFAQYSEGGSAYKYGFRKGFFESRYGYKKTGIESYSTNSWYRW